MQPKGYGIPPLSRILYNSLGEMSTFVLRSDTVSGLPGERPRLPSNPLAGPPIRALLLLAANFDAQSQSWYDPGQTSEVLDGGYRGVIRNEPGDGDNGKDG